MLQNLIQLILYIPSGFLTMYYCLQFFQRLNQRNSSRHTKLTKYASSVQYFLVTSFSFTNTLAIILWQNLPELNYLWHLSPLWLWLTHVNGFKTYKGWRKTVMHSVITEHFLLKKPDLILTKFIPGLYNNRKALLISYSKLKKYSVKKRQYVSK